MWTLCQVEFVTYIGQQSYQEHLNPTGYFQGKGCPRDIFYHRNAEGVKNQNESCDNTGRILHFQEYLSK